MKTAADIDSYLLKIGVPYEQLKPEMWLLRIEGVEGMVVSIAGPVVAFRLKVMELPRSGGLEELYRTLLTLNTTEIVHGAFGLEGSSVVLVNALELESLDFNEFQAVIDEFSLAVAKHYPSLSRWDQRQAAAGAPAIP